MSSNEITYEHPLNERLRFFLRLEFLFQQIQRHISGESVYDSHISINTLLDILHYMTQQDIKKEALKELDRINLSLSPLKDSPDIKQTTLSEILETIKTVRGQFSEIDGPIGKSLRENEFIKSLAQRSTIPGGLSLFDPPIYSYWLRQPSAQRIRDLKKWFGIFDCLSKTVDLVLELVRESAVPQHQTAQGGLYQQTLDAKTSYQMILVSVPSNSPYYAEISGGKHRFAVRFFDTTIKPRPMPTTNEVQFQLSCCIL